MELKGCLQIGASREETFLVEDQHTAYHIGSGDERVLGTPWMISFMERVSNRLVAASLPNGYMSVGFLVEVKHLAPTPANSQVRVLVEVTELYRNRVVLAVNAWDHLDKIGEGLHKRVVVEKDAFMKGVMAKRVS
jgi:predicted thioesterase